MLLCIRFLSRSCRIVRGLYCRVCHAAEYYQKYCRRHKRAAPYPILNHTRITFPAHNAYCELTKRAGINVQKKTRRPPDRRPKHVAAKGDSRYTVEIIQQTSREKWMQLTQQNNLPALALHRRSQCAQRWVTRKFLLKPTPGNPSA